MKLLIIGFALCTSMSYAKGGGGHGGGHGFGHSVGHASEHSSHIPVVGHPVNMRSYNSNQDTEKEKTKVGIWIAVVISAIMSFMLLEYLDGKE